MGPLQPDGHHPFAAFFEFAPVSEVAVLQTVRRSKYHGDWDFAVKDGMFHHEDGGSAVVFEVVPTKVLAFAKGEFAQTRFRFPTVRQ